MGNLQHILPSTENGRNGFWHHQEGITPLVVFRILFGLVVAFGALRFIAEGWIETLLVEPKFFFSFWGFEWIPRPNRIAAYALYGLISASAIAVSLGYRYRYALAVLFFSFTYAELLDATNYLNHYYLVILLTVLLFFIPANRAFSFDVYTGRVSSQLEVPKWCRYMLLLQLALVYFFAGLAKVNSDWLLEAMPMAIWLPARAHYPILGQLFEQPWVAYAFSWAGCLYDLTIVGWLLWKPTRKWAYVAVIVFHLMTWALFNIGLFPLIMMTSTLLFFDPKTQETFMRRLRVWLQVVGPRFNGVLDELVLWNSNPELAGSTGVFLSVVGNIRQDEKNFDEGAQAEVVGNTQQYMKSHNTCANPKVVGNIQQHMKNHNALNASTGSFASPSANFNLPVAIFLTLFFLLQVALPLRALAYPGPAAWGEEGYRFGWRVMLVEKAGDATFTVTDGATGRREEVNNLDYLTPYQVKQMAIQPDFILQFAHHLAEDFSTRNNFADPIVNIESFVALNGRRSRRLIDPKTNLALEVNGLSPKPWILPFER